MENLTGDLIIKIIISLPLFSIARCRCVCKSWYQLLDREFCSIKLNYDKKHENLRLLVTKPRETGSRLLVTGINEGVIMRNMLPEIIRQNVESKSLIYNEDVVNIMYPFKAKPCDRQGDGITIVGSSNGLVCASHADYIFYVWNPCTGEYKVIRSPFGFENRCLGFGYDSKTFDYKFVSIYCQPQTCDYKFISSYSQPRTDVSQVEIYSLGSDSWENYHSYNPYEISGKHGVFLNGAVHWVANLRTHWKPQLLISMDMEDGVFKEIPQPEDMDDFDYRFVDVLRGFLCLLCSVSDTKFEIWEMKHYGVRESWSKVFKINQQQLMGTVTMGIRSLKYIRRAVSLKDGEILLEIMVNDNRYRERVDVVKIHVDKNRRGNIKERLTHDCKTDNNLEISFEVIINKEDEGLCQNKRGYEYMKNIQGMEAYVESLVSVNSGKFVGKEQKDYYRVEELSELLLPGETIKFECV